MRGRVLVAGQVRGSVRRLDDALSFWGGFDPATGTVIDRAHPQYGVSLAGQVVVMPGSRGSSGTPGVLGEALRRGTGPAALILSKGDPNLVAGALVARALYGKSCPVVLLSADELSRLADGAQVDITDHGEIAQVTTGDEGLRPAE